VIDKIMQPIPHLLIRADAGGSLGTGHVMRMIALAQAYIRRGGEVTIASVQCPPPIIERVDELGVKHVLLKGAELGNAEDATATLTLCEELECEWLVLDGYHFDESYQKKVFGKGVKILAVDDYGHCDTWYCDAVLNQNLGAEHWKRGNAYNPEMQWLLGSPFALIREEFLESIRNAKEKQRPLKKILITLGGSDPDNVTALVLKALENVSSGPLNLRVLVGGGNQHRKLLEKLAEDSKYQIDLLSNVRDMPSMYEWADGVISAGGSTCWEWLAYGLPGAVVTIAENQEPIVDELNSQQLALSLGWYTKAKSDVWGRALDCWLNKVIMQVEKALIVDGKGADRVAALLHGCLKITIATAEKGWLKESVDQLYNKMKSLGHEVCVVFDAQKIQPSDILFLLSFWSLLPAELLARNTHNIVVHGSALPHGRGWSPVTWQILENKNSIPMTLFEAVEAVDAGAIYIQTNMEFKGYELLGEIQAKQADIQFQLCCEFVNQYPRIISKRQKQSGTASQYPRRSAKDSQLDPNKTLLEQFNLLRTVDNSNYPAFFELGGRKFHLKIQAVIEK